MGDGVSFGLHAAPRASRSSWFAAGAALGALAACPLLWTLARVG